VIAGDSFSGKVLWTAATVSDGFCGVADFNADGKPEVVIVATGNVYVVNGQRPARPSRLASGCARGGSGTSTRTTSQIS
jgi:hypothetical protein